MLETLMEQTVVEFKFWSPETTGSSVLERIVYIFNMMKTVSEQTVVEFKS